MSTSKDHSLPAIIQTFRTFSLVISAALEFLGYSYTEIKQRQKSYAALNPQMGYIVGSKAEGISLTIDSDFSWLMVSPECICVDDIEDAVLDGCQMPLLAEMDDLYPGYTKVKVPFRDYLMRMPSDSSIFQSRFENIEGVYLSSVLFNNSISQLELETPGIDHVIRYKSKILLQDWLARPRCHGWPSEDSLQEVAKLDWHLVPVGPQQTGDDDQKWRICFTLGELYLIKTFNITQLHLLILLQYIMRKSLKPVCSAFSSYMAKNLVFWMVEILSPENFKPENICWLMMMSIQMLRQAVENRQLSHYMIPPRNLMKENMSTHERNNIVHILDRFIEAGPGFIMNNSEFSKLQEGMKKVNDDPEFAQRELKRHIRSEKEFLDFFVDVLQFPLEDIENIMQSYPESGRYKRICDYINKRVLTQLCSRIDDFFNDCLYDIQNQNNVTS